jgi:gas vesicle protein
MNRRSGGDASFLIGIVLGLAIGAAIAVILAESTQRDSPSLINEVDRAKESLETHSDAKDRITGASEGSAPA